ncbi:MAG: ribose 5-phosphate isomerase B [bacterium]|jgi:ribose 5-phosphate isomerase B
MGARDLLIAIGSDHGGYRLKEDLKPFLLAKGYQVMDLGTDNTQAVDYPDFAQAVSHAVMDGSAGAGILICTTGIGVSIAANKVHGIRASLCHDPLSARLAREHNQANVLCLGGGIIGLRLAEEIVEVWLQTPCSDQERHRCRVAKIERIEQEPSPRRQDSPRQGVPL